MPASNNAMINKLQTAINTTFGARLLYNKTQFYSKDQERPITLYIIKKAYWDEEKKKTYGVELFTSTSQIQVVLYLRDYWFRCNGWELPTDNEKWNAIREHIEEEGKEL